MTTFDTDPNTHTIAAGWSSSPLGQPEREVRYGFATEPAADADDARPVAKHAVVAAALACGIAGGAALGLMLFEFDPVQPTVVVPGVGTSPQTAVVVTDSERAPSPTAVAPAREPVRVTTVAPAPASKARTPDVAAPPPAGGSTVVVDIPIADYPPLPEKPDQDDPEPPQPEDPDPPKPPVPPDLDFKLPEPPKPDPEPPMFVPDLPLAPLPQPDPTIDLPSPKLNPQPEPPSLPNFDLQAGFGS